MTQCIFCQWREDIKYSCCVFHLSEPATVQNPTAVHSARDDFLKVRLFLTSWITSWSYSAFQWLLLL